MLLVHVAFRSSISNSWYYYLEGCLPLATHKHMFSVTMHTLSFLLQYSAKSSSTLTVPQRWQQAVQKKEHGMNSEERESSKASVLLNKASVTIQLGPFSLCSQAAQIFEGSGLYRNCRRYWEMGLCPVKLKPGTHGWCRNTSLPESCTWMKTHSNPEFTSTERTAGKKKIHPVEKLHCSAVTTSAFLSYCLFLFWLYINLMSLKRLPLMLYAKWNH